MAEILAILQAEMTSIRSELHGKLPVTSMETNQRRLEFLQNKFDALVQQIPSESLQTPNQTDGVFERAEARSLDGVIENVALFLSNLSLAYVIKTYSHALSSQLLLMLDPGVLGWPLGTGVFAFLLAKVGKFLWRPSSQPVQQVQQAQKIQKVQQIRRSGTPEMSPDDVQTMLDTLNINTPKRRNRIQASVEL